MVDVTFLLLIFFMISAAFGLQKSFRVPVPDENERSTQAKTLEDWEEDPDVIVVRIDQFNTFHVAGPTWDVEQEAPSTHELLVKLRQASEDSGARRPRTLLIMAHEKALHERVIKAIDAGNELAIEDVRIVTVQEDS
jgi:biopolymer transport protein ExbD